MFDPIFEGRASIYLLLAAIGVGFLLAWYYHQRRRKLWYGVWAAVAAVLLYAVLDWAVETGREQAVRKVREMAGAVGRDDIDAAFRHIADSFVSPGRRNKTEFRNFAVQHRNSGEVTDVIVWDFVLLEPFDEETGQGKVSFHVKAHGNFGRALNLYARCEGVFVHDEKEGWQLQSFALFDPTKENEPMPFPH